MALFAVMAVGSLLQFNNLEGRPLQGDELGSILEAREFGRNGHSVLYFGLLRLWLLEGDSETWLRLLSALFGVGVIPLAYLWARKWGNAKVALLVTILISTSSFKIGYGQEVRFYSLFLFTSVLTFLTCGRYLEHKTKATALTWAASAALCVASHTMGVVLILLEGLFLLLSTLRWPWWRRLVLACLVLGLMLLPLLLPQVREFGFNTLAQYMNADSRYSSSRGLAATNLAKIPFTFFLFALGQYVYPLTYPVVVGGGLVFVVALVRGLALLQQEKPAFPFVVFISVSSLGLLYLLFDPLAPSSLQGAAPRYVIFLLPLFYFVASYGVRGRGHILLALGLLAVNLVSLWFYWSNSWSYQRDQVDWREAGRFVSATVNEDSVLVHDGRSRANIARYFPHGLPSRSAEAYSEGRSLGDLTDFSRIIFVSCDFRPPTRQQLNALLRRVANSHEETSAWVQYPLFAYVYDRKGSSYQGYPRDDRFEQLTIPKDIYGLEFQDLRLPLIASIDEEEYRITGAFVLPDLEGKRQLRIMPQHAAAVNQVVLINHLMGMGQIAAGEPVVLVTVTAEGGSQQRFVLRKGIETEDWEGNCAESAQGAVRTGAVCRPAFSWTKRLALVGNQGYPGAWKEFTAHAFQTRLDLAEPVAVRAIDLQWIAPKGTLYVWGAGVRLRAE